VSSPPAAESAIPVRRSAWRAAVGALLVVGAVVCAVLSRESLLASHPAYAVTLISVAVLGLLLVATGGQRVPVDRPRRRGATVVGRVLGGIGTVLVLGSMGYLVPLAATADAVAAMSGDTAVRVESSPTRIVLTPRATPKAGLVFLPGAKVDPRAYVPLLSQVSAAGYLVVIVKEPYDIALLSTGEPAKVVAATPGVTRWAVGGHSLGGVAAGIAVAQRDSGLSGLLLWASYPLSSLADRTDLVVASVSGTADGLTTPADIEASRSQLPPSTTFTAVAGGVHAYFGDYGAQPGDGSPGVDRASAQQQIVAASVTVMDAVAAGG
jgi:hypothetical protein